jgi:hypothetical protein
MAVDVQQLPRNDQVVLGAGVLVFIASFFPYYGASYLGRSSSVTSWHSYATLGLLLVLVATALAAVQVLSPSTLPESPVSWNVLVFGLSALGAILYILRSFTLDSGSVGGLSYGIKWGGYVVMILMIVQAVFAFLRVRASGDAMPWENRGGATTPPPPPPSA